MLNRLQDVFKSFQQHDVRYIVIGGIASVLYGVPHATFDLDILIDPAIKNVERLLIALKEAGFGTAALTNAEDIIAHEITIFNDRVLILPVYLFRMHGIIEKLSTIRDRTFSFYPKKI